MSAKDAIAKREAAKKPAPKPIEKPKRHAHLQVEDVPVEDLEKITEVPADGE